MPKQPPPSKNPSVERKIRTALVRCVGEQQIPYRREVLDVMARYAAHAIPAQQTVPPPKPSLPKGMTAADIVLLQLLAYGLSTAEVARKPRMPVRPCRARLRVLYGLLGVSGPTQAVAAGYEAGLLGVAARGGREWAVRPSAASSGANEARGRPAADRAAEGPSGASAVGGSR
jgi:hypothetical protein